MSWSNFPENWEKDVEEIIVLDIDKVPAELTVGTKYHCTWASKPGMVWVLKGWSQNNQVILETPRTKKIIYTHKDNLRLINKDARQAAIKRIKKKKLII